MIGARCHIPIADGKTDSVRHRARILDGIYAALRPNTSRRVEVVEGDLQLCRIKKYDFFVHSPEKWKEWKQKPHF